MLTAKSKSQTERFRFNLRHFSILLFVGVLGVCCVLGVLALSPPTPPAASNTVEPMVFAGRKAGDFQLQDPRDQALISLSALLEKNKAVALVFLGVQCPLNNQFVPVLIELHKEYSKKGVAFVGVNANSQDSRERVMTHARQYAIPFPVVKDAGNKVADQVGAVRTPEAIVVDGNGVIRYQGRIDDQFGIGYNRPGKPTRRDLALALDEVLAGKAVSVPRTEAPGCYIGRVAAPKADGPITYTKQVSRILQKNCQECHRPGWIGAMPLLTFDDALAWSDTIREVVSQGRMPPWYADPHYGKFSNDRSLSKEEKETLLAWIDNGTPRGDEKDLPPPRRFPNGWSIGKPDLIVALPKPYEVPAKAPPDGIPYQYITVDPGITEDCWVQRAEIIPGAPAVVHHCIVLIQPKGRPFKYHDQGLVLCGFGPGEMGLDLPEGLAKKVPAGAKLVFQMHYTPNGKAQSDRTTVGLIFSKKKPLHRVITVPIYSMPFLCRLDHIPTGADNYKMESEHIFGHNSHLLHFMPHMHLRGKDFLYEAIYPNGKKETLLSVPCYNFAWQSIYRLAEPLAMPKDTRLHCIAHFDNSAKNPNNPDPNKDVYWGYQTWEEMMTGWMDYYIDEEVP